MKSEDKEKGREEWRGNKDCKSSQSEQRLSLVWVTMWTLLISWQGGGDESLLGTEAKPWTSTVYTVHDTTAFFGNTQNKFAVAHDILTNAISISTKETRCIDQLHTA